METPTLTLVAFPEVNKTEYLLNNKLKNFITRNENIKPSFLSFLPFFLSPSFFVQLSLFLVFLFLSLFRSMEVGGGGRGTYTRSLRVDTGSRTFSLTSGVSLCLVVDE